MKRLRRILVGIAIVIAVAYLLALGFMFMFQRSFQYDPSGRMFDIAETGLTTSELVQIPSADGANLPSRTPPPAPSPVERDDDDGDDEEDPANPLAEAVAGFLQQAMPLLETYVADRLAAKLVPLSPA